MPSTSNSVRRRLPATTSLSPTSVVPQPVATPGFLDLIQTPKMLLKLDRPTFEGLTAEFLDGAVPVLVAIKQSAGILAWAARHHLPDSAYGAWLHQFADKLGRSDDTVTRWRDGITSQLGLPIPMVTQARSQARLSSVAGQVRRAGERRATAAGDPKVIELDDVGSRSVRSAVSQLVLISAESLAASASTEELRALATLIEQALAHQQREALLARSAARTHAHTGS